MVFPRGDSYVAIIVAFLYEPVLVKTKSLGSEQVRHKPGCTSTEDG